MREVLFLLLVAGLILAACTAPATPPPTESPSLPTPTYPEPTAAIADESPKEITLQTQSGTSHTLDWSPDGQTLAVGSGFEITLVSGDLTEILAVLKPEGGALGVTWNPDQTKFATVNGFENQTISIWDWNSAENTLTQVQEIDGGADQYGVSWSPGGKYLVTLADDTNCTIQIWDTNTWQVLNTFALEYTDPRRALTWSADSTTIYEAGELNGDVVMFGLNVLDGMVDILAKAPTDQAIAFAVSSDARKIAISDSSGGVRVFDPSTARVITSFQSVSQPVDMVWNPNGTVLAILDYETTLQVWNIPE